MNQKSSHRFKVSSPLGPLYLDITSRGLKGVWLGEPGEAMEPGGSKSGQQSTQVQALFRLVKSELKEYFQGNRQKFTVPLDLEGTEFQTRVWKELAKIPYGKTVSYKDIASRINHKKAFRAVGTANGKNPVPIIIPCHRVIAADGKLGGYSGGLKIKKQLLRLENA